MFLKSILWLIFLHSCARAQHWINASQERLEFQEFVSEREENRISQHYLEFYENKKVNQIQLLDQIQSWSKNNISTNAIEKELRNLQNAHTFSSSNRLALFEYFKNQSDVPLLCHIYANDVEIKNAEPFFDATCGLKPISLKDLNPQFLNYDYLLVDGNRIDIQPSSQIYSTGKTHQMVFISDRFIPQEVTGTIQKIKQTPHAPQPWVEGTCDNFKSENSKLSVPVQVYFSKTCTPGIQTNESATWTYIKKNKYTLITTMVIAAAVIYLNSQYELGVTLP
ncbi:MAG: hypothetical protein JNL11_14100 [Bdellovibrionaceae bacterium]|nr:hypothetical protein [Pseudobdellovibrionaceae bacterium]